MNTHIYIYAKKDRVSLTNLRKPNLLRHQVDVIERAGTQNWMIERKSRSKNKKEAQVHGRNHKQNSFSPGAPLLRSS